MARLLMQAGVALLLLLCLSQAGAQPIAETRGVPAPCFVVKDYYPFSTCKQEDDPQVCGRGFGAFTTEALCCTPGLAFPSGCTQRPSQCWIAENYNLRTCVRDDRKCLQGSGVFGSLSDCCTKGAAFPEGCADNVTLAATPCWVADTYYPARQCRQSRTLCTAASGVQFYDSKEACCGPSGPFGAPGCSAYVPKTPCYVVDSYYPSRTCRKETDVAACNKGWGVYPSEDVCCTPGAAFGDGCSNSTAPAPASSP